MRPTFLICTLLVFSFNKKDADLEPQLVRVFAFRGNLSDSTPADQQTLSTPAPALVEQVWEFVQKNTRHPMRVSPHTKRPFLSFASQYE